MGNVRRKTEILRKNQKEMLQIHNTLTKMKICKGNSRRSEKGTEVSETIMTGNHHPLVGKEALTKCKSTHLQKNK